MSIEDLADMTLEQLQTGFATQALGPVEVMETTFAHIEAVNETINALYDLRKEAALSEAKAAQDRYASGQQIGPFDGVPVTIKDSVNAVGMRWFHGSAVHGSGVVATKDAPPAARIKQAGAIILGKGIMPDFGLSGSGVSSAHGIVRNPWGLAWNTGGSSAGGGASLAAGIGMMSIGSDIAGSVRLPASHCGLAALKPTQGVIPHAPASTIRSAGPMVRKAEDLAAWTQLLNGVDDADRYSARLPSANAIEGAKFGATANFGFGPSVEPAVAECFAQVSAVMNELFGTVRQVDTKAGGDAYLAIDDALKVKGWQEYASADATNRARTPDELLRWFQEAEHWTSSKMGEINAGIERGVAYCQALFSDLDILLTPVMPVVNFPATERGIDPAMPLRHATFTALFNQSGLPAVSICGGFDARGLPIGVQLVGKRFDDLRLLEVATQLEAALDVFGTASRRWPTTPIQ